MINLLSFPATLQRKPRACGQSRQDFFEGGDKLHLADGGKRRDTDANKAILAEVRQNGDRQRLQMASDIHTGRRSDMWHWRRPHLVTVAVRTAHYAHEGALIKTGGKQSKSQPE